MRVATEANRAVRGGVAVKLAARQRRRCFDRFKSGESCYAIATSFLPALVVSVADVEDAIRWAWAHPTRKRRRRRASY